ncbi:hypothetical protein HY989_02080 [Candidatus Micrarchaeota archaeon]|nr:hypothetical protein [Candidatus Micrarchaeota archaeon]
MASKKPRIVETRQKRKEHVKPRIIDETDYSMLFDKSPESLILGKKSSRTLQPDATRDALRKDMLSDITPIRPPLDRLELDREIDEDQKKRHSIKKTIRKIVGLE